MYITHVASSDPKYKEFAKFCNSLRCPLCGSQLDGNVHLKEAKLYCVMNNDEYRCIWFPNEDVPGLEEIKYYYPQYMYEIYSVRKFGNFETKIDRLNMDAAPIHRERTRKNMFHMTGDRLLFFRCRMEESVFLNKLKLYNVFS